MTAIGPVAVVGGGIAGLTAALALARAGFDVELFERAERIAAIGAGLQLSPNALRVLDRLGLLGDLSRLGVAAGSVRLRAARSGRVLATVPVESRDGTAYLAIHRADLQATLLSAVRAEPRIRVTLGAALEAVVFEADHAVLRIGTLAGTTSQAYRLVVGADGVGSRTAQALGLPGARPSGLVAARYTATNDGARRFDRIEAWLGPKRHAVAYPMAGGAQVNIVLIAPDRGAPEAIAEGFGRWDPALRELVARAAFTGVWPLGQTEPRRRLVHRDRICLIGDAAHAMLPFAAQGAAMAIEDAFVLAQALASHAGAIEPALAAFERARLPRLEQVRRRVAFHRFSYHLPQPFALARDATLAFRSAERLRSDLSWLYEWTPPTSTI